MQDPHVDTSSLCETPKLPVQGLGADPVTKFEAYRPKAAASQKVIPIAINEAISQLIQPWANSTTCSDPEYRSVFVWKENSCHLDVFLEAAFLCLLVHRHLLTEPFPQPASMIKFITDLYGDGPFEETDECLLHFLSFRLHHVGNNADEKKAFQAVIDRVFSSGRVQPGQVSTPIVWFKLFGKLSSRRLLGFAHTTTTQCPDHTISGTRVNPMITISVAGPPSKMSLQEGINQFMEPFNQQDAKIRCQQSGRETSTLCGHTARIFSKDPSLPIILPVLCDDDILLPLTDVVFFGQVYLLRAVIRRVGGFHNGHFVAYIRHSGKWWKYDGLGGNFSLAKEITDSEAGMVGTRSSFVFARQP